MIRGISHPAGAPSRGTTWAAAVLLATGLTFLLAATLIVANTVRFRARSARATAVYVGSVERHSTKSGQMLYARFAFTPAPGRPTQRIVASNGTSDELFREGDSVGVYFDPAHPERARIATFYEMWLAPIVLAAPGLILVLIATLLAGAGRRRRRALSELD